MRWMEAMREMEIFFRQTPTTFFTFVNKPSPRDRADIIICRGFPKYHLVEEGAQITLWDANKSRKVHIFENPVFSFNWRWYPECLTLARMDPMSAGKNITYEELIQNEEKTS